MSESDDISERFIRHRCAPPHLFRPGATYFVTAHQVEGLAVMAVAERKDQLIGALQFASEQRGWVLLAWVALSNHHHCLLEAPDASKETVAELVKSVHKFTSRRWNDEDGQRGRIVWYQYWDTCITSTGSFFARMNYIHHNPVKHRLVSRPEEYPHSSYALWKAREDCELDELESAYPWERLDLESPPGTQNQ